MSDSPETDAEERDDQTFSMFGEAEMGAPQQDGYQVLARKYRPRLFSDLIGQEAMVRTLTNAFETGRVAHAFMLTGVRGVGKTTTARLLARALNYTREGQDAPSMELNPPGDFCNAIMAGNHPDVLELDAASRTGVADMRELLDGVRYSPVSARYKIYIIDEVHMLSIASFNALLKTLEEPPAHVKFIFATTEIRKVPITVLSRCQRFDLKRLETERLAEHLGKIAEKEGAKVTEEGLALIARAAEGSVRDGLSILDQAIVQALDGDQVSGEKVRDMLGLGDRLRLLDAFELAIEGEAQKAVTEVADQIHAGADPLVILKDMLEIAADIATVQAAGESYTLPGPADWTTRTHAIAAKLTPAQAQRNWQILLNGYRDTQTAPEADTALRMVILRLVAAASLPSPEEAARMLANGATGGATSAPGKPEAAAAAPTHDGPLNNLDDVITRLDARKEVRLWGEVRQYLRADTFEPGKLICAVANGAPPDLLRRLTDFLENETDMDWEVSFADTKAETAREREARMRKARFAAAKAHPTVAAALAALPGAEIIEVDGITPLEDDALPDNVVPIRPKDTG
ncbi:DNA polymerase III subunit gamma/tau [Hyphomonas sp. FCG-A18]|uniref:DNA polymerase III subunit gamma/tau n=1 Tax=Hyphomonas sp. FCG-A18 TaxID=3080019 RepID=UPI002B2CDA28|nr:DNA polymerase III subunit gamma/tau [Hyphomonas sp. FCG-A18]